MKHQITVVIDGQPIDFYITHHCPGSPATRWEPEAPEEIEWQAADPAIQALITHFGLEESIEEMVRHQAEYDGADRQEELDIIYGD